MASIAIPSIMFFELIINILVCVFTEVILVADRSFIFVHQHLINFYMLTKIDAYLLHWFLIHVSFLLSIDYQIIHRILFSVHNQLLVQS